MGGGRASGAVFRDRPGRDTNSADRDIAGQGESRWGVVGVGVTPREKAQGHAGYREQCQRDPAEV